MAKTKALISCAVTAQLICVFVFAYANCCFFFHAKAHYINFMDPKNVSFYLIGLNHLQKLRSTLSRQMTNWKQLIKVRKQMKWLAESSSFHLLTNSHVIKRFIFGHGVVIYYLHKAINETEGQRNTKCPINYHSSIF